jgi:hypothetical protein
MRAAPRHLARARATWNIQAREIVEAAGTHDRLSIAEVLTLLTPVMVGRLAYELGAVEKVSSDA